MDSSRTCSLRVVSVVEPGELGRTIDLSVHAAVELDCDGVVPGWGSEEIRPKIRDVEQRVNPILQHLNHADQVLNV